MRKHLKFTGKKGIFFQILFLVGFQVLFFTAIMLSMNKNSSTGDVSDGSDFVLSLKQKIDIEKSSINLKYASAIKSKSEEILKNGISLSDSFMCKKFNGISVVNGHCSYDVETASSDIMSNIKFICDSYFDMSCTSKYNSDSFSISMSINSPEKEYFSGKYSSKYKISQSKNIYLPELKLLDDVKEIISKLSSCQDSVCANTIILENPSYELFTFSNDNPNKIISDFTEQMSFCEKSIDNDCSCFNFDYSRLSDKEKILISVDRNGYRASLYRNEEILAEDFFPMNIITINKNSNDYLVKDLIFSKDGVSLVDGRKLGLLKIAYVVSDKISKLSFIELEDTKRSCTSTIHYSSNEDYFSDIFSGIYAKSDSLSISNFIFYINISEDKSIAKSNLIDFYLDETSLSEKAYSEFIRFFLSDEMSRISDVNKKTGFPQDIASKIGYDISRNKRFMIISIKVKNKLAYENNIGDYTEYKSNFKNSLLKSIRSVYAVSMYDPNKVFSFRPKDTNINYVFAVSSKDEVPPKNPEFELIYPNYGENNIFLKFKDSPSSDILGYNIYISNSRDRLFSEKPLRKIFTYDIHNSRISLDFLDMSKIFPNISKDSNLLYHEKLPILELDENSVIRSRSVGIKPEGMSIEDERLFDKELLLENQFSISLLEIPSNSYFITLTTFDYSGNENKTSIVLELDNSKLNSRLPLPLNCIKESFSLSGGILNCNNPTTSFFGNSLELKHISSKKIFHLCSNSDGLLEILDQNNLGLPTKESIDNCIKDVKNMYILSFFDNESPYFSNYIKDSKKLYVDSLTKLYDLGLPIYKIVLKIDSSSSSTTETYILEDVFS